MKKMISLTIIILIALTLLHSCDTTEPKTEKNITIQEYDVAVTEAYIHLSFESKQKRSLQLYRDNKFIYSFNCSEKDTVIIDTSLTKMSNYIYEVRDYQNSKLVCKSNKINITTLLPTSHDFVWQKWLFGNIGTNEINDIEIIDENNIWAVGSIWVQDSSTVLYNCIHWDGVSWKLLRVPSQISPNNDELVYVPLVSVLALANTEVLVTNGGQTIHWDGEKWDNWSFFYENINDTSFWGINKISSFKNGNILAFGNKGNLFGSIREDSKIKWSKIKTEYTGNYYDAWEYLDYNENNKILTLNIDPNNYNNNKFVIVNSNHSFTSLFSVNSVLVSSAWTHKGFPIFGAGSKLFTNKNGWWTEVENGCNNYIEKIRGTNLANIFTVGHFGSVHHYNGVSWYSVKNLQMEGIIKTISIQKDKVAIAGIENNKAIISVGRRN